jgi:hypothetical protein
LKFPWCDYHFMENLVHMNLKTLVLTLFLGLAAATSRAQLDTSLNDVDHDGYGGVYEVSGPGFDGGRYWWMCIEPGTPAGNNFFAQALSLLNAWDQQNLERQAFFTNEPVTNPGEYYTTAIPTQVRVMEYVLDTYLPYNLAGVSGRFLEQNSDSLLYGTDNSFYNAFFTVQNFLSEVYGKGNKTDFTDMSDFQFFSNSAGDLNDLAAIAARQALFDLIKDDVENKAGIAGFFDNYVVQGTYLVANTNYLTSDPLNFQDALIIVAPVPEPSGALLIACAGIVVMFRRFRRLA